jgi:hypothetical protein
LQGSLNGHKLQVMWYRAKQRGVFDTILKFHSSIVQCFISGWCAASLYHHISKQDKMVAWEIDGLLHPRKRRKAPQCVAKYQYSGFKLISYERKVAGLSTLEPDLSGCHEMPRSLQDKGCLIIYFKPYLPPTPTSSINTMLLNPKTLHYCRCTLPPCWRS